MFTGQTVKLIIYKSKYDLRMSYFKILSKI